MARSDRMPEIPNIARREFLSRMGVTVGAAAAGAAAGGLSSSLVNAAAPPAGQGQHSRQALCDCAHDVPDRSADRDGGAIGQGTYAGGRRDQRAGRSARQAQDSDDPGRRSRGRGRQRQGNAAPEAAGQHRSVHRHHFERQHARARSGGGGAAAADHFRRRLHGLPVRQDRHASRNTSFGSRRSSRPTASPARSARRPPGRRRASSPTSIRTTATAAMPSTISRSRSRSCCPARRWSRRPGRSSAPPSSRRTSPRRSRPAPTVW